MRGRRFHFGTKAETLERLDGRSERFSVPQLSAFSVARWREAREQVLAGLDGCFAGVARVAVRSSALCEDGARQSMAGAFRSTLDVDPHDPQALARAVDDTVASYRGDPGDQVLVQAMVADCRAAGVIMTHCLEDGSPYYVLNYDDESGATDTITGGKGVHKTVYVHREAAPGAFVSARVRAMVDLARELESIIGPTPLDIEFALDAAGRTHLFQVRPISLSATWRRNVARRVSHTLPDLAEALADRMRPVPGAAGRDNAFSNMADWNPAEMIGATPRPLAASLYRELITRAVWREARAAMGYREVPGEELMILAAGRPFIDIRNSFNSFLPAGLDPALEARLVEAFVARLKAHPEFHDKVEFEVVPTVLDFDFETTFAGRYPGLLDRAGLDAYRERLRVLTNGLLVPGEGGSLDLSLAAAARLEARRMAEPVPYAEDARPGDLAGWIEILAEECRDLGTRPFSIVARHAFLAEAFLRSAMRRGALAPERVAAFKASVRTVMGEQAADYASACAGGPHRDRFLRRFGHLRPGTYDITSPCYAQRPDLFNGCLAGEAREPEAGFVLDAQERTALDALLAEAGIVAVDAAGFLRHAARAVAGRESAKLAFTRNVSLILEALASIGHALGLDREDMSYVGVREVLDLRVSLCGGGAAERLREAAERGRSGMDLAEAVKLSYLIRDAGDISVVPMHRSAPNFVSGKRVEGPVVLLTPSMPFTVDLRDHIVCIENADPGYDWIFTRHIRGLVTKYGGANSHMAIRSAELGLPAAIGCGEQTFRMLSRAGVVELDCRNQTIRPL